MALGIINVMSAQRQFSSYLHDVTNAVAVSPLPKTVNLTWTDPDDTSYNGAILAAWNGTLVVRKAGSAPEDSQDGIVVLDSKTKNAYASIAFEDTGLTNGTTYYYRFFPYDTAGNYVLGSTVSAKPSRITVELPTVSGNFTYDGNEKTPTLTYDTENVTATGDLASTNAGEKSITFSLKDDDRIWSDGTYTDKTRTWNINKANNTLEISKTYGTVKYNATDVFFVTTNQSGGKLSVESADEDWASAVLSSSQVTVTCNGYRVETTTITIHSAETENYNAASTTYTMTSAKADGNVTVNKSSITIPKGTTTDTFTVNRLGTGTITVTSNNLQVLTVSGTDTVTLTALKGGSVTVTVSVAEDDNYTAASVNIPVTVQAYKIMTVIIDQTNSNPETSVTYADDAVGMTPGSASWDEWFGEYPVLFKNGAEVKKLNPNNFAQDLSGNSVDITSGDSGDIMIAFPRRGLKISTDANEKITISMTDNPNDSNFKYYAHQRGTTDKNVFYLGAYKGSEVSSKLRSLSGKSPAVSKTIGAFRTLARANSPSSNGNGGSGYDQSGFYQLVYRQAMYILKYKNLNSQSALGKGYVDGNSGAINTGGTNSKGMAFGETTGKQQMKLFGLEDFWGNVYEWIDGMCSDSNRNILTNTQSFNDTGSGYTNRGQGATSNIGNYISKVQGTTEKGFIIKETSGSATTYFCDYGHLSASDLPIFGGNWSSGEYAGAFPLRVDYSASYSYSYIGARLMYL